MAKKKGKRSHKQDADPAVRVIAVNRRARHDYHLEDRTEAGLVLRGSEVKSLRAGSASLSDAYGMVEAGEGWLVNAHIAEYPWANRENHAPRRRRKLLLHARELRKIAVKLRERGYTFVPLRLYFRGAHVKVELALARGKREYDKRETIKRRDQDRDLHSQLGRRR